MPLFVTLTISTPGADLTSHISPSPSSLRHQHSSCSKTSQRLNLLGLVLHRTRLHSHPLMLSTRPLHVLRPSLLPPLRASSSRIPLRTAQSDRYFLIRDFFTRQSSLTSSPRPPTPFRSRSPLIPRRWNSTTPSSSPSPSPGKTPSERPKDCPHCGPTPSNIPATPPPPAIGPPPGHAQDYTPFIRRLIQQSQLLKANAPHRPTKEQLLEAASSWWERLRIRIKWFTIRGWRRFNTDDLSAFASWFVLGNSESATTADCIGRVFGADDACSSVDPDRDVSLQSHPVEEPSSDGQTAPHSSRPSLPPSTRSLCRNTSRGGYPIT